MVRIAQAAERAGFDSLWAGGHPFLSEKQSRIPFSLRMLDSVVGLAFVAAHMRTIHGIEWLRPSGCLSGRRSGPWWK